MLKRPIAASTAQSCFSTKYETRNRDENCVQIETKMSTNKKSGAVESMGAVNADQTQRIFGDEAIDDLERMKS